MRERNDAGVERREPGDGKERQVVCIRVSIASNTLLAHAHYRFSTGPDAGHIVAILCPLAGHQWTAT